MKSIFGIQRSHLYRYKGYTKKQRFNQFILYQFRNLAYIGEGILGFVSFGLLETWWTADISEKIMRNQMKYYKEKKQNG